MLRVFLLITMPFDSSSIDWYPKKELKKITLNDNVVEYQMCLMEFLSIFDEVYSEKLIEWL